MRIVALRVLALTLVLQQLTFAMPARALVDAPTGLPVDGPAIARFGQNRALSVAASAYTGDATFRIPILTPPGTGGLTPSVTLTYSSSDVRRNGPLGVGWRLDVGPTVIERSTRDGAPEFDASDRFELSGQRLRETGTPGRYVAENYRFNRIEHITGGGDYWQILQPDGTRLYYGFEPGIDPLTGSILSSTLVQAIDPTLGNCPFPFSSCTARETIIEPSIPFAWYLDRIEDRNGNVIRLQWESLSDQGIRYLAAITYSQHVSGSISQVPSFGAPNDGSLSRTREILFDYDLTRTDLLPKYRTGFPRQIAHRLYQIEARVDGELVRQYALEYEQSPASGRSRLTSVRERDADGSQANERVHHFAYGDGGAPTGPTGTFWSAKDPRWDLPGSMQFLNNGADQGVRLVDVNTDGYPDVVRSKSGTRQTYLGGPGGFDTGANTTWKLPFNIVDGNGYRGVVFADLDGDGRQDLFQRYITISGFNEHSESCGSASLNLHHEVVTGSQGTFTESEARINTGSGWLSDSSQMPGATRFETTPVFPSGSAGSCPYEYLPTSDRVSGISAGFDQGMRVTDLNGDGRDDLVYYRGLTGFHVQGSLLRITDETRAGTLLNSPVGLAASTANISHRSTVLDYLDGTLLSSFAFDKRYDKARWQVPEYGAADGFSWSNLNTCKANNVLAEAHTGKERLVDINADGLPDILEAVLAPDPSGQVLITYLRRFLNNGYGWKAPSVSPENIFGPPLLFYAVIGGTYFISPTTCTDAGNSSSLDYGVRLIDVNSDGGPDVIGANLGEGVLLWKAEVLEPSPGKFTFWEDAPAWEAPAVFRPDLGPAGGVRLADVNNDGLVDLVVSDGAYLNLAEPPDRLATVTSPQGATTTLTYKPHTVFGSAPRDNPTVDGQYIHPHARWVLTRIDVDPGPAFGQPVMTQEFEYYDPIYDVEDRSFRGFRQVTVLGPVAGDVRLAIETTYHTSDALRGSPQHVVVSSVDVNGQPEDPGAWTWTPLREVRNAYAHASAGDASSVVTFYDGSVGTLADLGDTLSGAAFDAHRNLLIGSAEAAQAHLALRVEQTVRELEGMPAGALDAVTQSRFDRYGNAAEIVRLGDPTDLADDITTSFDYVVADPDVSGSILLTNRPWQIITSGSPEAAAALPTGAVTARTTQILYDGMTGSPAGQTLVRGNPTSRLENWTNPEAAATQVAIDRLYDVYGNLVEASSAYDLAGAGPEAFQRTTYDAAARTFPVSVTVGKPGDPSFDLTTAIQYETVGCGAPKGLGLPCTITDPNNQSASSVYDGFGRVTSSTGPNGAATALDYHDSDLGTLNQRIEVAIRWDSAGNPDPALDGNSIRRVTYFDGLGRTLEESRTGRGSQLATRFLDYDAAGRLVSQSRWDFGATAVNPTSFSYDALGRLTGSSHPDGTTRAIVYTPREVSATTTLPLPDGLVHRQTARTDAHGRLAEVEEFEDPAAGSGEVTRYRFDPFGQLSVVEDATVNNAALCAGNPICASQRHATEIVYDAMGNRLELRDPDAGISISKFDARGLVIESQDARGLIVSFDYDALGRLEKRHLENPGVINETDHVFRYGFEAELGIGGKGRIVRIDDGEGYEEFEYDAAGNIALHRRTLLDYEFTFSRSYGPLGRVLTTIYPDAEEVRWEYEKSFLTRIHSTTGGSYAGDYVADVSYDALDRPLDVKAGGDATTPVLNSKHSYDPISGRLQQLEALAGAQTLGKGSYGIDGAGRVRTLAFELMSLAGPIETGTLSYEYDGLDRLTSMAIAEASETRTFDYNALGNLVQKDFVDLATDVGFETLKYEDSLRPHAVTEALAASGSRSVAYRYDAAGNVIHKQREGFHGAAGEGVAELAFAYDSRGLLRRTRSSTGRTTIHRYGALGQRLGFSQLSQNGDADADMIVGAADFIALSGEFGSTTGGHADFTGDTTVGAGDFIVLSGGFGSILVGHAVLTPEPGYEYVPGVSRVNKHFFVAGARVASTAKSWSAPSASTPPLLSWRGPDLPNPDLWALGLLTGGLGALLLLALIQGRQRRGQPGPLVALRLRLGAAGTLLFVTPMLLASPCGVGPPPVTVTLGSHSDSVVFYATDQLGSTILAVTATGAVRNREVYNPYGDPGLWREGLSLRPGFTGQDEMEETGIYLLGVRAYDPETGRFLQPDPLVASPTDPQSFNRYAYAGGNPLALLDPRGLAPIAAFDCDGGTCFGENPGSRDLGPLPDHGSQFGGIFGPRGFDFNSAIHRTGGGSGGGGQAAPNQAGNVPGVGGRVQSQSGNSLFGSVPAEFRGAIADRFGVFRDFVTDNGAATLTVSGALNRKAGIGFALSITSDPQFENFTVDFLGGVGIGFGSSLTASVGLGGSGDVGLAVIGTGSRNTVRFVPEPGVFGALRVGQITLSGAAGVGVGEGTGVVFGISSPGVSVTRDELLDFFR